MICSWGTLTGINLDLGEIIWQVPLGTYPELEKQGLSPTGHLIWVVQL